MRYLKPNISLYILLFLTFTTSYGQAVDEYTLKAIWIGKFTHFIDWPQTRTENEDYFTISTLSSHPIQDKLELIYKDHYIWNKPVLVNEQSINSVDSTINILYIPKQKSIEEVKVIVLNARKHGILLIADTEGYAELGVHINFFFDEQRIRFEINETAMRESDFFISYRLLNIAKIIKPIEIE